jgi:ankyrin repeat protein
MFRSIYFAISLFFLTGHFAWGATVQDLNKALIKAAEKGNQAAAKSLLKKGADPNARVAGTWLDYTPLLQAVAENHLEVAELLLDWGADPYLEDKNHDPVIVFAAHKKGEKILRLLLARGVPIDSRNSEGSTAVERLVVSSGASEDLELLFKLGADPNQKTRNGSRLLHQAVHMRNVGAFRTLVRVGADINARDENGRTALINTADYSYEESLPIAKILVEAGADINAQDADGATALLVSTVPYADIDVYLIEHGADANLATRDGYTPLMRAAEKCAFSKMRLLVEHGADVRARTKDGMTAVHIAAGHIGWMWEEPRQTSDRRNQLEMISLLQEKGADLTARTAEGRSALHFAAESGYASMLQLLLEKGLDPVAKDKDGDTPLHCAVQSRSEGKIEKVKLLLPSGVNFANKSGDTPLLLAVAMMDRPVCALLLDGGALVDVKNVREETPLLLAASSFNRQYVAPKDYVEIIRRLSAKTPEIDRRDGRTMTAAMWAAASDMPEALEAILEQGADLRTHSADGRTCLMWAASSNALRTIRLLISRGADPNERDSKGGTAADWARAMGYDAVVSELEKVITTK